MSHDRIKLPPSWKSQLLDQFDQPYMDTLRDFLLERGNAVKIYPPPAQWFSAFNATPFDEVKVVILGQDPYHGPGQAHGMCFSVLPGVAIPPSLRNIYKELHSDLGIAPVSHGYLQSWATQGVFLLNSVLTVEHGQAAAHQGKGWEQFTDVVVEKLSSHSSNLVFMLWGGYAKKKGQVIDTSKHCVLTSAHPSPLSVRGFTGCRHFSKANEYLTSEGKAPIDWQLPETVVV
jgi:uracil-DNA glycosylase